MIAGGVGLAVADEEDVTELELETTLLLDDPEDVLERELVDDVETVLLRIVDDEFDDTAAT